MNKTIPEVPISLIRGGPLYWVQEKAHLIQPNQWNISRRLTLVVAIAWLPLLVVTTLRGGFGPYSDLWNLLTDFRMYARVFVAIPLLLIGQIIMEAHFREMAQHFLDANLVRTEDLSLFRKIMDKAVRLRDAKLPEILIVLAVFSQIGYFMHSGRLYYASWAVEAGSGLLTPAGYYSMIVVQALLLGLIALAVWKWIIWIVVLWNLSRIEFQLDSTDGDLTAGLGFLGEVPMAFVPVVLAISAVIGASWRFQVLAGNTTLGFLKLPAGLLAIIVLLIFLLPLLLFTPRLIKEKKEGNLKYGSLRHLHSLQFRDKWIEKRKENVEDLLGCADVSSLADISASFKNVDDMTVFPFGKGAVIALVMSLALPMIPTLTATIPLKEVFKSLLEALH